MSDISLGRDLHIDAVLSGIMLGRKPEGFIADQVVPILGVGKRSDVYYKTNHLEFRRYQPGLTNRAPGTKARKVQFSVSSDTYYAKNYALGADMVVEDMVTADDVLDWAGTHAGLVTDMLKIDYEVRVANIANTNAASVTHVATPWSNVTGSRPLDDLDNMREAFRLNTGLLPNVMIYPEEVGVVLRKNDQVRDRLFGDRGGTATDAQIAALVNMPKVLVPSVLINSAGLGETLIGSGELHGAWAKKVFMMHVNPLPGRQIDTWVQGFRWTSPLLGVPWAVARHPFDSERLAYALTVAYYQDEKIVSSDLNWAIDSVM
jgi:hypothetical protein